MDNRRNRQIFEELMGEVERPGVDQLMYYIRNSDFYTAPASRAFHLSAEGGLLQHSLNVFRALEGSLKRDEDPEGSGFVYYDYICCGKAVARIPRDSVIVMALLHDLCKTNFYVTEMRWRKDQNNKWEQYPTYKIEDKVPYGHGEKSVMMVEQFMKLTASERYAIRWHMGFADGADTRTLGLAVEKYPVIWALHNADMMASKFMEAQAGNKPPFDAVPEEDANVPDPDTDEDGFAEAGDLG